MSSVRDFSMKISKSVILSVSIAAMLIVTFQYAYGLSFGNKIQLSDTGEMSIDPLVGAEGRNVYVLWNDGCFIDENDNTICNDISFRRSGDFGTTFDDVIHLRIDNNEGTSGGHSLTESENNVYASWVDNSEGNNEIFFAASNDRGKTFDDTMNLSENEGNSGIEPASMAASGDNAYVAWTDETPGNSDVLFRASHDGGNSFGDTTNLSDNDGNSEIRDGLVASGDDDVYAVWQDETEGNLEVFFRASHDGGEEFGDTMNLSESGGQSFIPLMTAFEEAVYVAWFEVVGPCNNLLRISHNGGEEFGEPICLDDFGISGVIEVAAVSDEKFYVIGFGQIEGVSDVLLMRSNDGGENFKVVGLEIESVVHFEKVAISGNRIFFAWTDFSSSGDEFLKVSTDGGRTFGSAINITDEGIAGALSGQSVEMALAANKAYFVWSDSSVGNLEVFFEAAETARP